MFEKRIVAAALAALLVGSAIGAGAVSMLGPTPEADSGSGPASGPDADRTPAEAGAGDPWEPRNGFDPGNDTDREELGDAAVEQFDSEDEFRRYVVRNRPNQGVSPFGFWGRPFVDVRLAANVDAEDGATADRAAPDGGDGGGGGGDERVSDTNVQERGIDEPDVLKTDGQVVFYAGPQHHRDRAVAGTTVVDISEAGAPEHVASVPTEGQLLLADDVLVVETGDELVGYDVSDPGAPERIWRTELNDSVVTARLLDGRIYLVTRSQVDVEDPCPVEPFGDDGPAIGCTEVYHPATPATAEATYTTAVVDPDTGDVEDTVTVVGSSRHEATYVSENAVYLTYSRRASYFELFSTFLLTEKSDVLDEIAERRIRELRSVNISDRAKGTELRVITRNWYDRLPEDRREEVREAVQRDYQAYLEENRRDVVRTGVVKVAVDDGLSVAATGEVPGYPLNQFSMDESDGRLRIATTVGRQWGGRPTNDLYVLDGNLSILGAETGMADNERIFSVRFVGDTAYLVTFRRIDPFHVVDLSDPTEPEELGNVELPGFSTYLHPIGDDRVLGIGEEDGEVKAVIFDVSEPSDPTVEDSLILDERWSAVSATHHAFLQDERHGVFFLPGRSGGYVIDYADGSLAVEKRVTTRGPATRAMYHGDYLYVFDGEGVVVVDETDWSTVDRVEFDGTANRRLDERIRPIDG